MFGFGLKAKTERVLSDIFFYSVAPSMRPVFNGLVSQGKSMGQNEFSIAFYYMMIMMNSLIEPFEVEGMMIDSFNDKTDKEKETVKTFIKDHSDRILKNLHHANSPESDIKEMLQPILEKVGLAESETLPEEHEEDSVSQEGSEDDGKLSKLMEFLEIYKSILLMHLTFIDVCEGTKYLSDYQKKFVLGLQYLGVADFLGQTLEADDMTVMAAFAAKTADAGPDAIFGWDISEAGQMFRRMTDVQTESWAQKIMINGGQSAQSQFSQKDDADKLPLLAVYEDLELMKEVARNLLPE
jgi:hypothetical protein